MATRVIKTGSTGVEFTTAPEPLQIQDLDGDLDAIFSGIDNTNIAPSANIATSKIAQDGGIQTGHLANGAVTLPKIAPGATLSTLVSAAALANQSGLTAETAICTLPTITTRGGLVVIGGGIGLVAVMLGGVQGICRQIVYRGVTPIFTIDHKVLQDPDGQIAIPTPIVLDQPGAGSFIYKLTIQLSAGGSLATSANPGSLFAVEFA